MNSRLKVALATGSMAVLINLAGCQQAPSSEAKERAELAAFAGGTDVPTTQPTQSQNIGAIVSADKSSIRVVNFSAQSFSNLNVWINNTFVMKLPLLPAAGGVSLDTNRFYAKNGQYYGQSGTVAINSVSLEAGGQVWNLLGPISDK